MRAVVLATFVAVVVNPSPLLAQEPVGNVSIPLALQLGLPQGEFAENVNAAGGVAVGGLWRIAPEFALRAEFNWMLYGSERRRLPLGGGGLGLINIDVTTNNQIVGLGIGAQVGTPGPQMRPYIGGMIGLSNFNTISSASGSNSDNEPFASSTNASDNAFAKTVLAGLYVPIGAGGTMLDLGVRHTWNGEEVKYLTPGDITEDGSGNIVLTPQRTRADLLTVVIGVTIRPSRSKSQ